MARCPFGPHRLLLNEALQCKRCGADLNLYAAVRDLPVTWYNQARRLWDTSEIEEASACLHAALKLRPDFPEAHWLLGMISHRQGNLDQARLHLSRARALGAQADPDGLTAHTATKTTLEPDGDGVPAQATLESRDDVTAPPPKRAARRGVRWHWPASAVAAGLVGLLIGLWWPWGKRPTAIAQPAEKNLAARAEAAPVKDGAESDLAARGQQALKSAEGVHSEELRITSVGRNALKVEGRAASLQEKARIEEILRALPDAQAVDVGRIDVQERYRVRPGDTLWSLAAKWYRDSAQWQRIAAANSISSPDGLRAGAELIIPR